MPALVQFFRTQIYSGAVQSPFVGVGQLLVSRVIGHQVVLDRFQLSGNGSVHQAPAQHGDHEVVCRTMIRSLWSLLTALCFVMPISGALASAKLLRVGIRAFGFSVFVGLTLGFGCAWTMQKVGGLVYAHLKQSVVSVQERYFRLLYFGALVWIVFALFLGDWVTSALLRVFKL